MSKDMKTDIDQRLFTLSVDEVLTRRIINGIGKHAYRSKKTKRRTVIIAAVMCSFLFSATALASTVPAFNNLIAIISPEAAQFLKPINKSAEDNGIKMEVLSALTDGKTAVAYISFQDLTDNRIDETVDLYDYDIKGAAMFTSHRISYDEETKTAIFCIVGTEGENFAGKKISVSASTLLYGKTVFNDFDTGITLRDIVCENSETIPLSDLAFTGGGYKESMRRIIDENRMNVLRPDTMAISLGDNIDFVTISNVGFVDGLLHIQTKWEQSVDNHGDIFMKDNENQKIIASTLYFRTPDEKADGISRKKHIEYVYDISPDDDLSRYSLWAWLCKEGGCVTGNWEVTFPLDPVDTSDMHIEGLK